MDAAVLQQDAHRCVQKSNEHLINDAPASIKKRHVKQPPLLGDTFCAWQMQLCVIAWQEGNCWVVAWGCSCYATAVTHIDLCSLALDRRCYALLGLKCFVVNVIYAFS
jgi:hypothetical protein